MVMMITVTRRPPPQQKSDHPTNPPTWDNSLLEDWK